MAVLSSSFSSTFFLSRQLLAAVVVIVYGFGRHFVLPSVSSFPDCMCRRGGGGLRPYIYPSIHLLPTSFFFFSFVAYNKKLTREIRNDGETTMTTLLFSARFLFLSAQCAGKRIDIFYQSNKLQLEKKIGRKEKEKDRTRID